MPEASRVLDYLQDIKAILVSETLINQAIRNSAMLIDTADINRAVDLHSLKRQFNNEGNRRYSATYRFIDPPRVQREVQAFLRPEVTEREKIAYLALYFEVGNKLFGYEGAMVSGRMFAEALQIIVARRLKPVIGFTTPLGYEPTQASLNLLDTMRDEMASIHFQATTISALNYALFEFITRLSKLKQVNSVLSQRYQMADDLLGVIGEFSYTHNFFKLMKRVQQAVKEYKQFPTQIAVPSPAKLLTDLQRLLMGFEVNFVAAGSDSLEAKLCVSSLSIFYQDIEKEKQQRRQLPQAKKVTFKT